MGEASFTRSSATSLALHGEGERQGLLVALVDPPGGWRP